MTTRGPLTLSRHSGGTLVGRERTALQLDEALGRQGVRVFATSPSGFKRELNISRKNGVFSTDFQPDEIGVHLSLLHNFIMIRYKNNK